MSPLRERVFDLATLVASGHVLLRGRGEPVLGAPRAEVLARALLDADPGRGDDALGVAAEDRPLAPEADGFTPAGERLADDLHRGGVGRLEQVVPLLGDQVPEEVGVGAELVGLRWRAA